MRLSIKQFQQINEINKTGIEDLDKSIMFVQVLTGKSEFEVNQMKVKKFNKLCNQILTAFNSMVVDMNKAKPVNLIKANVKWDWINYDIAKVDAGRYGETATFGVDLIENLHKIMATMVVPMKWTIRGLKPKEYDATNHEEIANDMAEAEFKHCYHAAVFFLRSFQELNSRFSSLYGNSDEQDGTGESIDEFQRSFGWIYNAKLVSEFEDISLDDVWKLPVIQFLNDLTYLRLKIEWDANKLKQSSKRSGN